MTPMKQQFVVTDNEGNISFSAKRDAPETFKSWATAKARAAELANSAPGEKIGIYQIVAEVIAPVSAPVVLRTGTYDEK